MAEAVRKVVGYAVVVAVQDHGVHAQGENLKDDAAAVLEGNGVVDQGHVIFFHDAPEILDFAEDGGQANLFLFEPRAVDPDDAMYLVAFKADQG